MHLIVCEFLSLDGVMQAPGDSDEDRSAGFEHGGWQLPYLDQAAGNAISDGMATAGGFLLGRRTYELFAGFWPSQPDDDPIAATLNNLPKYVASTTLQEPLAWRNATLLKGDAAEAVATLKRQPGKDLHVIGSGELARRCCATTSSRSTGCCSTPWSWAAAGACSVTGTGGPRCG